MKKQRCIACGKEIDKNLKTCGNKICKRALLSALQKRHKLKAQRIPMSDKEFMDYLKAKYQQWKEIEEKGYFIKTCKFCGKEFKQKKDSRLYCSDKCRVATKAEMDRNRRLERKAARAKAIKNAKPIAKNRYAVNHNLLFVTSDKATDFYSYDLKDEGLSDPVKISDSILSGVEFNYYMSIKAITFMKPIGTSTAPIFEEEYQRKKEELCKTQTF